MSNGEDWMSELMQAKKSTLEERQEAEEKARKNIKRSRSGAKGRPRIQGLERELVDRAGKRGPLVMIFGQGPRTGNKQVSIAISNELAGKLDKYTTGSRAQVLPLLAEWALQELAAQGKCISATAVK